MTKRTIHTREFKLEAVRLLGDGEKKVADLARELGVARNKLYKWREQLQGKEPEAAFPGSGRRDLPAFFGPLIPGKWPPPDGWLKDCV